MRLNTQRDLHQIRADRQPFKALPLRLRPKRLAYQPGPVRQVVFGEHIRTYFGGVLEDEIRQIIANFDPEWLRYVMG